MNHSLIEQLRDFLRENCGGHSCENGSGEKMWHTKSPINLVRLASIIRNHKPEPGRSMESAPKDGNRLRLHCADGDYDGWWEENLGCFLGMDSEWNLLKLEPIGWFPLSEAHHVE